MELRILIRKGIFILGAALLISAIPYRNVFAAELYPYVYDDRYANEDDYMALTEIFEDYTVLPGDSLWKIAEEQLGSADCYIELAKANPDVLTNPDLIYPGMQLNIVKTGYIRKDEKSRGGMKYSGKYAMDTPYGWTFGLTQSGDAFANFVVSGDGAIACLFKDKTKEVMADVLDWQECMRQISTYAEKNYGKQVSDLCFEHYRMDEQAGASGDLYLYSYVWHISPDDYPNLTSKVCVGLKLTDHIQAEFLGYALDDYDIQSCVRYVTASFEELFDAENDEDFTVNDTNMSIVPETEWQLQGMYNSFAYIDEFYTARLNKALEAYTEKEESRYKKFY